MPPSPFTFEKIGDCIPPAPGISYQQKGLELLCFMSTLLCLFVSHNMNVQLERSGSLAIKSFKALPPGWKGNECQDLLSG